MNINDVYINDNVLDIMFDNLNTKQKISFCYLNSYTYNRYTKQIKDSIYKYINVEYVVFYELFRRYNYNSVEMSVLKENAVYDINPIIDHAGIHTYYDLRFIFEIVYKYNCIFDNYEFPKNKSNLKICIENIRKKISFNRYETMNNINNDVTLYPLTYIFKPLVYKTREDKWTHLIR